MGEERMQQYSSSTSTPVVPATIYNAQGVHCNQLKCSDSDRSEPPLSIVREECHP